MPVVPRSSQEPARRLCLVYDSDSFTNSRSNERKKPLPDEKSTAKKSGASSLRLQHCNSFKARRLANNSTRGAPRRISGFHLMDKISASVVSCESRVPTVLCRNSEAGETWDSQWRSRVGSERRGPECLVDVVTDQTSIQVSIGLPCRRCIVMKKVFSAN